MDRPVFKVVIFSECVVLISGIGMAPPSGMGGSETSEYSHINIIYKINEIQSLSFIIAKLWRSLCLEYHKFKKP